MLVTRATQRERGETDAYPLACPHFLTRGCCERGARCRFVHPLFMLSAPLLPAATQSLPAAAPQQHQHDQPRSASLSSPSSLGLHARTQHAPVTRGVSEAQPPPVASPLPTSNDTFDDTPRGVPPATDDAASHPRVATQPVHGGRRVRVNDPYGAHPVSVSSSLSAHSTSADTLPSPNPQGSALRRDGRSP